jgi:DNA topoisomerase-1
MPITRRRVGRGFQYFDGEQRITKKEITKQFTAMRIPPAWRDVRINLSKRARIRAVGYDAAGRKQYIYSDNYRAKQEKAKFERILRFARALPLMRVSTEEHLRHRTLDKEKVLACIVRLMDEAFFRVGNEEYARDNHSYGITTLRSKHLKFEGNTIVFDFIGKSGQHQHKKVTDRRLANILKQLDELPGYEIFKYINDDGIVCDIHSDDVNEYIKSIMGEEFSAKDFRTWGGTLIAAGELVQADKADSENQRKKVVTGCVKKVAFKLGNTPAIARKSYIDPRVINAYMDSGDLSNLRTVMHSVGALGQLRGEEKCVLYLLEHPSKKI